MDWEPAQDSTLCLLEILVTLVLYICEIRKVRRNLGEEEKSSDFFDFRVVHQNREEEKNPSGFFDFS